MPRSHAQAFLIGVLTREHWRGIASMRDHIHRNGTSEVPEQQEKHSACQESLPQGLPLSGPEYCFPHAPTRPLAPNRATPVHLEIRRITNIYGSLKSDAGLARAAFSVKNRE